ncbi:MAG TPA: tyrosine-type recombinase/integrase [Chitinophagaceae bacterium]|nr:tyrosine-type recombinase/integrase [Chitinophagaceae bacterium]
MNDLIPAFLEYLQFEKRYSVHTIRSYGTDLQQLDVYLNAKYGPQEVETISAPLLRSWLVSLKETGTEARSINRKISAIKSFFRFHKRKGSITRNPSTVLKVMKTGKRLPSFLKEEQTLALMVPAEADDWKSRTSAMILEILYNTGLRVSELVDLKEKHIDEHKLEIKVLGKGNKERIIPLKKELMDKVKAYKAAKLAEFESPDLDYLLVNSAGKKLYVKYVYREVREQLKDLKQVSKKSPHVMRHTFATQLVNNGADLNAIKELLGHASLAATQVYTHNTIEKLKDIHKKAHPKA